MKTLHARLKAYEPDGGVAGFLPQPLSWDASFLHNDDGALSLKYSRKTLGGGLLERGLEKGLEIAVEVSDGGAWVEPYNARFILLKRSVDKTDATDTVSLTCPSYSWLLNKVLNNDTAHLIQEGDDKGKRAFNSSNPGLILKTLLDENSARGGAASKMTLGFDTAKDSAGIAWKSKYSLKYSLGTSVQAALASMVAGGAVDWRYAQRTLNVWNADSTSLSRDLSAQVRVSLDPDVLEAPEEESIEELASDILVAGDNDLLFRESNSSAPTPWGKWESYVSQGGVSDEGTAKAFMQSTLASSARVRGQYVRSLNIARASFLPLVDYRPGDWITAPTVVHGEKVRVQQVTLSMDDNGLKASVTLNDKVYDSQIRQAKKVKGITGGSVLAGSEGARPAEQSDHRVPTAPLGVVAGSSSYIASNGVAFGVVSVEWSKVTTAVDSSSMEISSYRVEYRKNIAGATWASGGVVDGSTTRLAVSNLECGVEYAFRVRAVPTYSDQLGEWSEPAVVLVDSDVEPPSVPSAPSVVSRLGVVDIAWDGLTATGTRMERDFSHVEVGSSSKDTGFTGFDRVDGDGHCIVTGLVAESTVWFALRAVDNSGNKSEWSSPMSVVVEPAVTIADFDALNKVVTQAKEDVEKNSGAIEAARKSILENSEQSQQALDKSNSVGKTLDGLHNVFIGPNDPVTLDNARVLTGDMWQQTDDSSVVSSVSVYDGEKWNPLSMIASNVMATGTITGDLVAARTLRGDSLIAGSIETEQLAAGAVSSEKIQAGAVTAREIKASSITSDLIAAGQFKGYVFTGSIFQSSEEEEKGFKLKDGALDFWDADGNHTVHLDGDGEKNLLTGTFSTALTGRRVFISPDFSQHAVGAATQYTGSGIRFYLDGEAAVHPYIASESTTNVDGDVSGLGFNSGYRDENDPGAWMGLRVYGEKGNRISHTTFLSRRNYADDTSPRAFLSTHSEANSTSVSAISEDANGSVGMEADISTGYLYLGGYLGGLTGRGTFKSNQWCAWKNGMAAGQSGSVEWTFTPTKFGRYFGVANADTDSPDIQAHVHQTGGTSSIHVMTKNYGGGYSAAVWLSVFVWLAA